MFGKAWTLTRNAIAGFLADDALTRAAAIAYFTVFSIAPLLLIVIAIVGLAFGRADAQDAIVTQISGLVGNKSGEMLRTMLQSAQLQEGGIIATVSGAAMLLVTASGAFTQIQSSLNAIWKAEPEGGVWHMVRARLLGLGLVLTLGFLMLVSLVASAAIAGLGQWLGGLFPGAQVVIAAANIVLSLALLAAVFAAIFKLLPDRDIAWRDVGIGAAVTAVLFVVGKTAIGIYVGTTGVASGYGAAGALIALLVWVYYSSLIFLLGAEFTRAYAELHGSRAAAAKPGAAAADRAAPAAAPEPALPSEILLARADLARRNIDTTWRLIRDRSRGLNPSLPDERGERPSMLQTVVAAVAVLALPPRGTAEEAPPPIAHRRVGAPAPPQRLHPAPRTRTPAE